MGKHFNYTEGFRDVGGYNTPQPGMTPATDLPGNQYYGHDGFIYNMTDGSRRRGNPPTPMPETGRGKEV
jgi:hypothetical protein